MRLRRPDSSGRYTMTRTDSGVSSVMAGTEMVFETSVYSPFDQLTQLLAQENITHFSCCEIFKLYKKVYIT